VVPGTAVIELAGVRLKIKLKPIVIIGLVAAIAAAVFFFYAGQLLVAQDEPEPADLIVVLMGGGSERILGAVDLYKEGYGSRIIMVQNNHPGYEVLETRGVKLPREPELAAMAAVQLGVPEEAILILPGDAESTLDEAMIVAEYFKQALPADRVLLVTSKSHSLRSAYLFRWAFRQCQLDTEVLSCPTPYDTFNAPNWWRTRGDAKQVVMEYIKLVASVVETW
jgi:uncharacterized SAM-binding protein YcdF (DUF218 family)